MRNGIYIGLLVAAFVLVCLAAHWQGRRIRARARNAVDLRYQQLRFVLVVLGFFFLLEIIVAVERTGQPLLSSWLLPAGFALAFGIALFQFLRMRRKWLEQPGFGRFNKSPAFFWQGAIILLPVAVLAAVSLISLRRDERAAENDARQRAAENVQGLARAMRSSVDEELHRYVMLQQAWMLELHTVGQSPRSMEFPDAKLQTDVDKWEHDYRRFKLAELALPEGTILADGRQIEPPDVPAAPRPPKWFRELSPQQRGLWDAMRAARSSNEINKLCQDFRDTDLSEEAGRAAELLRWAPAQIIQNSGALPSESGISFEEIATYELLTTTNAQLNDWLLQSLWWRTIEHPSIVSSKLLHLAGALTNRASDGQRRQFTRIRGYFDKQSLADEHLAFFHQLPDLQPWKKLWWSHWNKDFSALAIFQPNTFVNYPNDADGIPLSGPGYHVFLVPGNVVDVIFNRALEQNKFLVPPYITVQLTVEGAHLPRVGQATSDEKSLLAEAQQKAGSYFAQDAMRFDVKFYLTSREQMLSAERRRAGLFGALILGAALTAFAGLFAARRAFQRQWQLNELKTNFVSSVSHELRAPIASVRLMAENLERGKISETGKQNEYFRFIVQECRRLSSLIENVLDFSRIEQGRKQYEFEPTNLVALVETTVKLMEPYAAEKGVRLETFNILHSTSNIELNMDGRAIQQALVNLIDNAVKHSPKGESVTVEIESRKQKAESRNSDCDVVCISVSDHGPGIPLAEREKIFERFYRLGSELRRETQGVGIGLSVVKHIVDAHGGRVRVESEPGKGSRFTIELPGVNAKAQSRQDTKKA